MGDEEQKEHREKKRDKKHKKKDKKKHKKKDKKKHRKLHKIREDEEGTPAPVDTRNTNEDINTNDNKVDD